ncbi:unnamed protein product [Amoebophrya sp. A120]|nr:unnamed protein product [Amoebophrya sp. A120]|eukprot:GSA120T00002547001.1
MAEQGGEREGGKGFRTFMVDGEDSEKRLCGTITFPSFQKERNLGTLLGHVLSFSDVPRGDYSLVAVENGRKIPLTDDAVTEQFFAETPVAYPTIEVHKSIAAREQEQQRQKRVMKKDHVDQLELENRDLRKNANLMEKKLEDFKQETKRTTDELLASLQPIEMNTKRFMAEIEKSLAETRSSIETKITELEKGSAETGERLEEVERGLQVEVAQLTNQLSKVSATVTKIADGNDENEAQRNQWVESIKKGFATVKESVSDSSRDVARLKTEKVDVAKFQETVDKLATRCSKLESELEAANAARDKMHHELLTRIDADAASTDQTIRRLDTRVRQDITNIEARRKIFNEELDKLLELRLSEIKSLCGKIEGEKADILELEDARAGLASEVETLANGLGVVNAKHDVTKGQFDEFVEVHQKRVTEFEQEFGKALVQAKLEFRLDSQKTEEGYLASTKMLNILQKELGDFINQNGRHISLLQHEHQGLKEGLLLLDSAKNTITKNMKTFAGDYQAFVDEQDHWNEDATKKITNILQAMQPTKLEWRIENIAKKLGNTNNVPVIRSESFRLNSVPDLRMDFYPEGLDNRIYQEGVSAVRFFAPKGSRFKYEVSIGRVCEGIKVFDGSSSDGLFWIDLFFAEWQSEISQDAIVIVLEVVENMNNPAGAQKVIKLKEP